MQIPDVSAASADPLLHHLDIDLGGDLPPRVDLGRESHVFASSSDWLGISRKFCLRKAVWTASVFIACKTATCSFERISSLHLSSTTAVRGR